MEAWSGPEDNCWRNNCRIWMGKAVPTPWEDHCLCQSSQTLPRGHHLGACWPQWDWQLLEDLRAAVEVPQSYHSYHPATRHSPCVCESTKQDVLQKLTVLWVDRLDEAFESSSSSTRNWSQSGYRARCLPVEVGCREFAACSFRALSSLGSEWERKRRTICCTTGTAEKAIH